MSVLKPEDYTEPCCCFATGAKPDAAPTAQSIPVPDIVRELDGLLEHGDIEGGRKLLERALNTARDMGDWRGELSIQSELMGLHRRTGDKAAALSAVEAGLAIIGSRGLSRTVSGATVTLNAATTLKAFGQAKDSLPLFDEVLRVYSETLDPRDYRFAGLYNNMALSCADVCEFEKAEALFRRAMAVISALPSPENELAVTLCNLAELYERRDPEDERIAGCMEKAWDNLNAPGLPRDGYHAFTASKCAPTFAHFGYFIYDMELRRRAKEIYEGT